MSWLAPVEAAKAKAVEELLRLRLLHRYRRNERVAPRLAEVSAVTAEEVAQAVTSVDARSIPGAPEFVSSGWADHMLLRYLLPLGRCVNGRVLDTCCGLGWGSYLVASLAAEVIGVDLDGASVGFCARRWPGDNLSFRTGSVLELPFPDDSFDVVLCMEAIEHFSRADGERLLTELRRVCRRGGALFGSSAFPETRWATARLCAANPHHLHIHTRREMEQLLRRAFGAPSLLTRHYFRATKL